MGGVCTWDMWLRNHAAAQLGLMLHNWWAAVQVTKLPRKTMEFPLNKEYFSAQAHVIVSPLKQQVNGWNGLGLKWRSTSIVGQTCALSLFLSLLLDTFSRVFFGNKSSKRRTKQQTHIATVNKKKTPTMAGLKSTLSFSRLEVFRRSIERVR